MRRFLLGLFGAGSLVLTFAAPAPAAGAVHFSTIHYLGSSTTNTSINKEYVTIRNSGTQAVQMRGWKLIDERTRANGGNIVYKFPRFKLRPGDYVNVHTGQGARNGHNLYWGLHSTTWDDTGSDTAYLRNKAGSLVDTCTYDSTTDTSPATC